MNDLVTRPPSLQNFQPSSLGLAFSLLFPENCRDCKYESCPLDGIQMEIDQEGYTFLRFGITNVEWRNMVNFWGKFRLYRVQVIDKIFCEACAIKIHVRRWNHNMNEHNVKGNVFHTGIAKFSTNVTRLKSCCLVPVI
jgi:hypothetical protein